MTTIPALFEIQDPLTQIRLPSLKTAALFCTAFGPSKEFSCGPLYS